MSMLHCSHLWYRPSRTDEYIFRAFDLRLDLEQRTVLVGESGTGKTTLGLLLAGALSPAKGRIFLGDTPIEHSTLRVGFLRQNPEHQLIGATVERDVAYGLENEGVKPDITHRKVRDALRFFGLDAYRNTEIAKLAGGEKQKTGLAGLLAMNCDYLILDEPTSFLDYPMQTELYEFMEKVHSRGIGFLWITQYPEEQVIGDRVLELGWNDIKKDAAPGGYQSTELTGHVSQGNGRRSGASADVILSAEALRFQYPSHGDGEPFLLSAENYTLHHGEIQGWYGYSGSGKSTFARIISRILPETEGKLHTAAEPDDIVYIPQFAEQLLHTGTLNETILVLRERKAFQEEEYRERLIEQLIALGIDREEPFSRPVWTFSGGEQRRIVLAVGAALTPELIIFDEPTIGIGPGDRDKIKRLFHSKTLSTIICISHEYEFLKAMTERGVYFSNGNVSSPMDWQDLERTYEYQTARFFQHHELDLSAQMRMS
ncbi:MAG TPA: ABC transporter ATP-binding protein [bacterium]|nr:ABC transporter ATP-binding protein [bacterium]